MSTQSRDVSRSFFSSVPTELRQIIWEFALPEDVSEVCHAPKHLKSDRIPKLFAYTAYPVLMHVCRESREFAMLKISFIHSEVAACLVPIREFCPDLDVFYIANETFDPIGGDVALLAKSASHLAFEVHEDMPWEDAEVIASILLYDFQRVKTLAFVLNPDSWEKTSQTRPIDRRHRLWPVADQDGRLFIYCERLKRRMDSIAHQELVRYPEHIEGCTWNMDRQRFNFETITRTLFEYCLIDGNPSWVASHRA
ncbi:hypothetical protein F5B20DRAFT_290931 [Whalleya microplaca]|nr:hypothetical protein F5B20DRAFT_290931 [Whalleya microplaca]